ncbi:hypothetical protein HQQ80_15745 [Microbacteriaceae bacterium VKM Ac-2855]|nr:hypothetical protein [Microbacteriaceae bacterium VKM Ac-2855]
MSPPDSDPARALTAAVLAAAFAGDAIARMHERLAEEAGPDPQQQRWATENVHRELRAARSQLSPLSRAPQDYWASADPDTLAHHFRLARAWAPFDAGIAAVELWLRTELAERYAITVPPYGRLSQNRNPGEPRPHRPEEPRRVVPTSVMPGR